MVVWSGTQTQLGSAPIFFLTSTHDLPSMTSQKYAYADDLALLYASRDRKAVEDTQSQDMTTLSANLQIWRLKLNNTKMVTGAFHLKNREDKRAFKAKCFIKNKPKIYHQLIFKIYLSIIKMTEATDYFLLVQLICLEFHTSDNLHLSVSY